MALEFRLPDIGEGVAEGEIVKWLVNEGDTVQEDQPIVEIMTDKATVEIPSPVSGVVKERKHAEGAVVPVDDVLVVFETDGSDAPAPAPKAAAAPKAAPAPKPAPAATASSPSTPAAPAPSPAPAAKSGGGGSLEFRLPDIGEGVAEGEVVKWLVAVGDTVQEDQPLVEIMTDKATVEIPSPSAGQVQELRVEAGQTVPVGEVLVVLSGSSGASQPAPAAAVAEPVAVGASAAPVVRSTSAPVTAPSGNGASVAAPVRRTGKVLATPATRKLAREMGIDLQLVPGTGPRGRVTKDDLDRFQRRSPSAIGMTAPAGATPARPAPQPLAAVEPEREERVPFRGIRRKIAESMTRSKYTAVHFTYVDEVDVSRLVESRGQAKAIAAEQGVKLTYLPYIVKATVAALKKFPIVNSSLDEAAGELIYKHYYHIGIATDTPNGLVVPVIKNADQKSLLEIASEVTDLATRARDGKLQVDEMRGGTFTITNAGNIGGLFATPVINFPEVAIMGVHQIKDRPVIRDGQIVAGKIMYLSISLDHRIVDGAVGARFMNEVIAYLEQPDRLLLEMR